MFSATPLHSDADELRIARERRPVQFLQFRPNSGRPGNSTVVREDDGNPMTDDPIGPSRSGEQLCPSLPFKLFLILAAIGAVSLCLYAGDRYQQRRAVARIEELGGTVGYDYQYDNRGRRLAADPVPWRRWLRPRLGDAWFGHVTRVSLSGTGTTDDDLRCLTAFSRLSYLKLSDTEVTGLGFVYLKGLTRIERVDLENAPLSKKGLSHLRELGTVHHLDLWGVEPAAGLISELENFRRLSFLEWDIGWGERRHWADRLENRFSGLLIYSP